MEVENNGSFVSIPQWIEAKLFENILKQTTSNENYKSIKEFLVKPLVTDEENNDRVMLRIKIEIELKDLSTKLMSFILKTVYDNEISNNLIYNIFDIEKSMYDEIVPNLEKLYSNVGVEVKFGAKSFHFPCKRPYILLENLSLRGFKNVNRLEGLDKEHTKCVLKKLAQWHAASAALVTVKGPFEDKFIHGHFREENKDQLKSKMESMGKAFVCFAKTYSNSYEYANDIHSASTLMIDEIFKIAQPDPNEFNVLNHGECCSNNILFQYDAFGKIKETYFLDYQLPKYGTPVQDLYNFLLSSTKYEIKIKEFDYFIKFYHDNLVENLKLLNYSKKIPTLSGLHSMLYKYGVWGFSTVMGLMAETLFDSTIISNKENLNGNSVSSVTLKTLMFSNKRYRQHAEAVLPWLKNRGALSF